MVHNSDIDFPFMNQEGAEGNDVTTDMDVTRDTIVTTPTVDVLPNVTPPAKGMIATYTDKIALTQDGQINKPVIIALFAGMAMFWLLQKAYNKNYFSFLGIVSK